MNWHRPSALLTLIGTVVFQATVFAYDSTTVVNNGDPANRVDIVFVGDGYQASELGQYAVDVQAVINDFFQETPFREYQRYFNIHRVDVISNQSGADHPENGVFVDTALDSTFNCGGILRLLCANGSKVFAAAGQAPAAADTVLVVVNDPMYGGAGGSFATFSVHPAASEIALHELGHSFGRLADEYDYGSSTPTYTGSEPTTPNLTIQTNRALIKWTHWIAPATPIPTLSTAPAVPGLYEGGGYHQYGIYRPTYNSKMRSLGVPYEQINVEQLLLQIYNRVSPIDRVEPTASSVTVQTTSSLTFRVTTTQPSTHSLNIRWLLDGIEVATGESFLLDGSVVPQGSHAVRVEIRDPTQLVRSDPTNLLTESASWSVTVTNGGSGGSGIDLVVSTLSTTATAVAPGRSFALANTVSNQGSVAAGSFIVAFHLSSDASYGGTDDITFTTTRTVTSLGAGANSAATTSLVVPTTTPLGSYYLCALADSANAVTEDTETNNARCTAAPIQVALPDLVLTDVSFTATTVNPGASLAVSTTVANQGALLASSSQVAFRLSTNQTYGDGDDVTITTVRSVGTVAAGASSTATTNIVIPSTTPLGRYHVCATADRASAVAETNEGNNALCSSAQVKVGNRAPLARISSAAPTSGTVPLTVNFDGSGSSDPDGDPITHTWDFGDGESALEPVATHTYAAAGEFTATLTVSDGTSTSTATATITVTGTNRAPIANAGADQSVTSGATVMLDGSGSSDPDGDPLTYAWTQTGGPAVTLTDATSAQIAFVAPSVTAATLLTFELTVSDGALSATQSVSVSVLPETGGSSQVSYVHFDILVAIYTGSTDRGQFTPAQVQSVYTDMADARTFYWRNSRGGLNLTLTFLEINESKVATDYDGLGLKPPVVAQDLRERGVTDDQYDVVVGVAPGNGFYGRGTVLGLGSTLYSTGFTSFALLHELHHSLEAATNTSGFDYLDVHPNFVGIYGGNYDVNAYIFRMWPRLHWFELLPPWGTPVTVPDSDGDGLADDAPQAVLDERRFGTDPVRSDSDGDGLSDLQEAIAGQDGAADPLSVDTDGDGLPDGGDSAPLYAVRTWVPSYSPTIDGTIEAAWPLFYHNASQDVTTHLAWDATGLHLAVRMASPRTFTVVIDANHDGWLRGPTRDPADATYNTIADNYEIIVDPVQRRVVAAHARYPETAIWGGSPVWEETLIQPSHIALAVNGTGTEVELTIPSNTSTYLLPAAGTMLGVTMHSAGQWYFDREHLIDVTLTDTLPADLASPVLPTLTGPRDGYEATRGEILLFEWSPVLDIGSAGLEGYQFQLDDQVTFESPVVDTVVSAAQHPLTLPTFGTYYWRVRAKDRAGNTSAFTATRVVRYKPIPPLTALVANPISGLAPLDVAFDASSSTDPDGTIVDYAWNFGDGGTATGATVQHTFTSPGSYTTHLTVTDDDGQKSFDAIVITVGSGASEILVSLNKPATAKSTRGMAFPRYANDGDIANPSRVWDAATDNAGEWWQVDLGAVYQISRIKVYPWVINSHDWYSQFHIDVSPTGAFSGEQITVVTELNWDLTNDAGIPVHYVITPAVAGQYVRVTADIFQRWTLLQEFEVLALGSSPSNVPPTAVLSADPLSGPAPLEVTFDASASTDSDGTIMSYAWNFGDGATGSDAFMTHSYATEDSYTVTLTVTDDGGSSASASASITVTAGDATPPVITDVQVSGIASTEATITWMTNEPATSQVEYDFGVESPTFFTSLDETLVTEHAVTLTGLEPNATYHYRVRSRDAAGNEARSADGTFTTPRVSLRGRVTRLDGTTAIAGAKVEALQGNVVSASVMTGSDGSYTFPSLPEGTYTLRASKTGLVTTTVSGVIITITQETVVDLQLPVYARITGTIRDSQTSNPIPTVSVQLKQGTTTKASASTSSSGTYTLNNVAPGTYDLVMTKTGYLTLTVSGFVVADGAILTGQDFSLVPGVKLTGTITAQDTGSPIASASVQLRQGTAIKASTTSTATGTYTLATSLPAGTYDLVVMKTGYATKILTLTLPAGLTVQDVVLELAVNVAVTIGGTIRDGLTSQPISGASIQLLQLTTVKASTTSRADGTYMLSASIPPGRYSLKATKLGYLETRIEGLEITGAGSLTQDLTLQPGVAVSGTIRECLLNGPVSGVSIQLKQGGVVKASTTSSATGTYNLKTSLVSGTYELVASKTGYASQLVSLVLDSQSPATQDFTLCPSGGVVLSGTITDVLRSLPLASASIQLKQAGLLKASTTSRADGTYLFVTTLPSGMYDLVVTKSGYVTQTLTGLSLTAGTPATQDVALNPVLQSGVTVYGLITDATTGNPLASASIQLKQAGLLKASTTSKPDGTYLLTTTLAAGTYDLVVSKTGYVPSASTGLALTSTPAHQDVVLTAGVSLQGTVTNALTDAPIASASIQLKQNGTLKASTVSSATGTYTLTTSLPAGTYTLVVIKSGYQTHTLTETFPSGTTTRHLQLQPSS